MKQLALWPDTDLSFLKVLCSLEFLRLGYPAGHRPDTGMCKRANVALCLSHFFLFLEFLWKFSYETDSKVRMNNELLFNNCLPLPPHRPRAGARTHSTTPDESNVLRLHKQILGLLRTLSAWKVGMILQWVQMSDLDESKFLGFTFSWHHSI